MKTLLALLLLTSATFAADFTITFTLPDDTAAATIADLATALGYQPTVFDDQRNEKPNPVDRVAFIKAKIGADLIARVSALRAERAAQAAAAASKAATDEAAKAVQIK